MQPSQQPDSLAGASSFSNAELSANGRARARRRRKRRPVLGFVPRVALIGAASVIAIIGIFALVAKLMQPYQMQRVQSAHIRQIKTQLASTQAANGDLQNKIAALQRPDGEETEARSQGFLLPGEVSLDITAQQPAPPPPSDESGISGILRRAYHHLTGR